MIKTCYVVLSWELTDEFARNNREVVDVSNLSPRNSDFMVVGDGEFGVFQMLDSCLISGSHMLIQVSSAVIIFS